MTAKHAVVRAALGRRLLLRGLYTEPVLIESIAEGGDLLFLRVRTADGPPDELRAALTLAPPLRCMLVGPDDFALLVESEHIRLAYAFAPYFAVSLSGVRPLPHQFEAQDAGIAHLMQRDVEVGQIAMCEAMAYERACDWEVEDVSWLRDDSGFDLHSLGPADEHGRRPIRRIEVKGCAAMHELVVLTPNEWLQASRHAESYWLYVVWGCRARSPQLITIQNPVQALGAQAQPLVEVKEWLLDSTSILSYQTAVST